eukprot:1158428-Pelagomonas_calceolata.AAC.2
MGIARHGMHKAGRAPGISGQDKRVCEALRTAHGKHPPWSMLTPATAAQLCCAACQEQAHKKLSSCCF